MVEETSVVTTLPLPWYEDQVKVGRVVPGYTGMVNSHGERVGMAGQSQTRGSVENVVKKPNDWVVNITAAKKTTGYVTVNGINLMKL